MIFIGGTFNNCIIQIQDNKIKNMTREELIFIKFIDLIDANKVICKSPMTIEILDDVTISDEEIQFLAIENERGTFIASKNKAFIKWVDQVDMWTFLERTEQGYQNTQLIPELYITKEGYKMKEEILKVNKSVIPEITIDQSVITNGDNSPVTRGNNSLINTGNINKKWYRTKIGKIVIGLSLGLSYCIYHILKHG